MFLSSEELSFFYKQTKYYSTKKLLKLEYYLRHNNTSHTYNQLYKMVEIVLIKRGEKPFHFKRNELVDYLDKCLSISNPMGRLSARIIGYFAQLIELNHSSKL